MKLSVGDNAPDFTLSDQNGKIHSLSDYKGSWVLFYFYPEDDTSGCTKEACDIRDNFSQFRKSNITVLGVSPDPVESHKKFADKYSLPFTLLADPEKKVVHMYDVWQLKNKMGKEYMGTVRTTFLINPNGKIAKIYERVNPEHHIEELLTDIKQLITLEE